MVKAKNLDKYTEIIYFFGDKDFSSDLEKFGIKFKNIITTQQIHGNRIAILENDNKKFIKEADGMITDKLIILGIRTADCLPIFFYDYKRKIIAAIHAGWKGLSKGIIHNAISGMKKLGSSLSDVVVSVGPHIQICCYDVPEERIKQFQVTDSSDRRHLLSNNNFSELRSNSWYLDLGKIALIQLKSLGIKNSNIDVSDICTNCNRNYWSYRRDRKKADRMLNIIGMIE